MSRLPFVCARAPGAPLPPSSQPSPSLSQVCDSPYAQCSSWEEHCVCDGSAEWALKRAKHHRQKNAKAAQDAADVVAARYQAVAGAGGDDTSSAAPRDEQRREENEMRPEDEENEDLFAGTCRPTAPHPRGRRAPSHPQTLPAPDAPDCPSQPPLPLLSLLPSLSPTGHTRSACSILPHGQLGPPRSSSPASGVLVTSSTCPKPAELLPSRSLLDTRLRLHACHPLTPARTPTDYEPRYLTVGQPHPDPIVETTSLSFAEPPVRHLDQT